MNKLTLNEIVGYLPFKLQVLESYNNRIGVLHSINVNGKVSVLHKVIWDFEIEEIKPILNRIEDMSEELLDKWIYIQERVENNLQFSIQANEFMYSNHIDIHNLIDRGLAVDKKNYTTMNKELIEQIRNGKALHYDIDNVELLNEVCYEAGDCQPISYKGKYYLLGKYFWYTTDLQPAESIKLSDFLPKMISVEAVKEFIHKHVFYQDNDELIDADQLLTFLNTHTNVK